MKHQLKTATLAALVTLMAAPVLAGDRRPVYAHDPACEQTRRNGNLAGALIGGVVGAALGREVAARNARDEGLLLGGVLGAAIGANAGSNRVYCGTGPDDRPIVVYDEDRYDDRNEDRYDDRYDDRDWDRVATYDDRYAYPPRGHAYGHRRHKPACRLSESTIRLPNGRIERRVVEVCRDRYGEWRVKD